MSILKKLCVCFLVFLFTSNVKAQSNLQIILICPSVYRVMAPNDELYYNQSRNSLVSSIEMESIMKGLPPNYMLRQLGQSFGKTINNVDDLIDLLTNQLQKEIDEGKISTNQLEQMMSMCPAFWE